MRPTKDIVGLGMRVTNPYVPFNWIHSPPSHHPVEIISLRSVKRYFFQMTILMTSDHDSFLWYSTVLLLIIPSAKSQCASGTCEKTFISITTDTKQNSFLDGYVFETLNVSIWKACAEMCLSKCQCLSLNFNGAKKTKNCELNDANTKLTPGALKEKEGVTYYEPARTYNDKNVSRFVFG